MLVDDMLRLCNELGLQKIKVRGDNVMFNCPYHGESNPSCGVSIEKEVGGCFACGQTFNLVQLVSHCRNCSLSESIEWLSSFLNRDFRKVAEKSDKFLLYGESFEKDKPLPITSLAPFRSGQISHPYLLKRGFWQQDFIDFKLGWDSVKKRITIPFFDSNGNLLGFSGRAVLNTSDLNYEATYGNEPKYFIYDHFNAKDYFYPLDKFAVKDDTVILVEGLLDAVWLHKFGFTNTLSIISAEVSKEQIRKLKLLNAKTIILCLDNDSAGEKGCQRLYKFLRSDFNFKRVVFPSGKKDVQDCSRDEILSMFENLEDYPKRVFKKYE